jgi:hypothetical protein
MPSIAPLFAAALLATAPVLATEIVAVPQFRSVELRGGGDVEVVPAPVQRVTLLSGSRAFTDVRVVQDGTLEITTNCDTRCPRNYPLHIRIETPYVPNVAVSAGGTIVARPGFASQPQVAAAVHAGGTIDLRALEAANVSAAVHAGGDIYVHPRDNLSAAVNAGGDVHYSGHPRVAMAIANGGDVRPDY